MDRRTFDIELYNYYIKQNDLYYDCMINEAQEEYEKKLSYQEIQYELFEAQSELQDFDNATKSEISNNNYTYISHYEWHGNIKILKEKIKDFLNFFKDFLITDNSSEKKIKNEDYEKIQDGLFEIKSKILNNYHSDNCLDYAYECTYQDELYFNCHSLSQTIRIFSDSFENILTNDDYSKKHFKISYITIILNIYLYHIRNLYEYIDYYELYEKLENEIIFSIKIICACIVDYYSENFIPKNKDEDEDNNKTELKKQRLDIQKLNLVENIIHKNDIDSLESAIRNYFNYIKSKNHEYYINRKNKIGFVNIRKENTEKRKREMSNLISKGYSNIAISKKLGISKQAVGKFIKKHKLRITN